MKKIVCIFLVLLFSLGLYANQSDELVAYAQTFIGRPYRSGGNGPNSFDCSGFTKYVFSQFGYTLNRSSASQVYNGTSVKRKNAQKGDLIFFKGSRVSSNTIGHVGIVISEKGETPIRFVHASVSGGVRIDDVESDYYSRRFVSVARVLPKDDKKSDKEIEIDEQIEENKETEIPAIQDTNVYIVKKGDTMYSLSKLFGCTVEDLKSANNMTSSNLSIGQKLKRPQKDVVLNNSNISEQKKEENIEKINVEQEEIAIPDTIVHVVQKGETLYRISKKYDCTTDELRGWNNLHSNIISIGQKIQIVK